MSDESEPLPRSGQDWAAPGRFALVLALMVLISFHAVLLGRDCFVLRDFGLFSYPNASFLRDCFWRGELPLWNPLNDCGTPFLAQLNTLTLYPPSLIYLLLPLSWALPFFCLLHLFLGGMGMYFLARRWSGSPLGGAVAGTIFAFNGLSLDFLMWPSHIATFALMPWVIWLAEEAWREGGRKMALAALAAAFQILAGGPETILLTWLMVFLVAVIEFKKRAVPRPLLAGRLLTTGMTALCLAAAQLLPFIDLSLHSSRTTHFGDSLWSMPPCGWANFLVPLFQTTRWQEIVVQPGQYWTSSYYAGIGALFLAVAALCRQCGRRRVGAGSGDLRSSLSEPRSKKEPPLPGPLLHKCVEERESERRSVGGETRDAGAPLPNPLPAGRGEGIGVAQIASGARCERWRVWLLGGVLVLSLILALGDNGFLFKVLRQVFPFLGLFRYPIKFVLATLCVIPILAAFGIKYYENRKSAEGRSWRLEWVLGAVMVGLIAVIVGVAHAAPGSYVAWTAVAVNGLERVGFLGLTIWLVTFLARRQMSTSIGSPLPNPLPAGRGEGIGGSQDAAVPRGARGAGCGWMGLALPVVFWLDVVTSMPWQNPSVDSSIYQPGLALQAVHFQPAPAVGESRIMTSRYSEWELRYPTTADTRTNYLLDRVVFLDNCNLLDSVPKVDGFFSLYLNDMNRVLSLLDSNPDSQLEGLKDVMAVSQTVAPGKVFDWVGRTNFIPWVTIGQGPVLADDDGVMRGLCETNNDLHQIIFLPLEARGSVTAKREETARIVSKEFGSSRILVNVETPATAIVSLSQAWYHDWKAYVDGKAVPLWRANGAFQAVEVPRGRHEIKLVYEDAAFRGGAVLSIIGLMGCLVFWTGAGNFRKNAVKA